MSMPRGAQYEPVFVPPDAPGRCACKMVRDRLEVQAAQRGGPRAWALMHENSRALLAGLATNRDPADAQRMAWDSFTADERNAIGAAARQLARDMAGACLLR